MPDLISNLKALIEAPGSEFWSAIVGAVVGGMIAFVIQRQERNASRKEREEDRKMEAESLAYSLLFKVISIHASFGHIKKHVDEGLELGRAEKVERISQTLLPIANPPSPVEFASGEMAMLLALKDDDVFNSLASLDKIHNSIIPVWTIYEAKRSAIATQAENHSFNASEGRGEFNVRQGSHLQVMIFEVEGIAKELVRRAQVDFEEADAALTTLVQLLNDRLNLGFGFVAK